MGDVDGAVVVDVDLGAGHFLNARMFLPPGPMSRPIFSGLIFVGQQARGVVAEFACVVYADVPSIAFRISRRASCACSSAPRMIVLADAVDLEVELDAGDALLGAGDLEVHVAEVVFVALDVGEQA